MDLPLAATMQKNTSKAACKATEFPYRILKLSPLDLNIEVFAPLSPTRIVHVAWVMRYDSVSRRGEFSVQLAGDVTRVAYHAD